VAAREWGYAKRSCPESSLAGGVVKHCAASPLHRSAAQELNFAVLDQFAPTVEDTGSVRGMGILRSAAAGGAHSAK
jgi:hypothetical protein